MKFRSRCVLLFVIVWICWISGDSNTSKAKERVVPPPEPIDYPEKREEPPEPVLPPASTPSPTPEIPLNSTPTPSPNIDLGMYYALVIGNDTYTFLPQLQTAQNDARAVSKLLKEQYGFTVKHLLDATRTDIMTAINTLRHILTEHDNLLVYYAGHGLLDEEADEGYWLPVDAKIDDNLNWIANSWLRSTLKAMKARHVLIVSDSCYSGTLTRGFFQVGPGPKSLTYWERLFQKKTRGVLASGGLQTVSDIGGKPGHSVFASAFLQALQDNTQPIIEMTRLFPIIRHNVMLNEQKQEPVYADIRGAGGEVGGDFLFKRTP